MTINTSSRNMTPKITLKVTNPRTLLQQMGAPGGAVGPRVCLFT